MFSSDMFTHVFFAVLPVGACQAARLKASYTFAVLQEYRVQIAVLKKTVHIFGKNHQYSPYNFVVSTGQYSYISRFNGNIGVDQPVMSLKMYREINEIQDSI